MFDINPSFALQGNDGQSWLLQTPRLKLQAVDNIRKLRLQARPGAELNTTSLERLSGILLPPGPQEKVDNELSAYWLAPNDWLLVKPESDIDSINSALQDSSNEVTYVVTDLTDAYSIIDISGEDAVARLAEGCSVDLDGKAFPSGRYALTRLQHLSVIIHRLDDTPRFRVLVDRSVARFLRDWLMGAIPGAPPAGGLQPSKSAPGRFVMGAIPGGFVVR